MEERLKISGRIWDEFLLEILENGLGEGAGEVTETTQEIMTQVVRENVIIRTCK